MTAPYRLSFGNDPVRPFHQLYEDCRAAELGSPFVQVCFRHPTGAGAGPSRKDRDALRHDLLECFAERRPTNRHDGIDRDFAHQVGGFAGEEDLHVVPGFCQDQSMREDE